MVLSIIFLAHSRPSLRGKLNYFRLGKTKTGALSKSRSTLLDELSDCNSRPTGIESDSDRRNTISTPESVLGIGGFWGFEAQVLLERKWENWDPNYQLDGG